MDLVLFYAFLLHSPTTQAEKWSDLHIDATDLRFLTARRRHLIQGALSEYGSSMRPEGNRAH